jgi:capsid protein
MLDATAHGEDDAYWIHAQVIHADEIANPRERQTARSRSRYQYLNDGYCRNLVRSFYIAVLGLGARLQLLSDNKNINQSVEKKFHRWINESELTNTLELAVAAIMYDGESFLRFVFDPHIECGLGVSIIDAERVGSGWNGWNDPLSLDGIRFDNYNHPIAYCVFEHLPNPSYNFKYLPEVVPSEDIVHFFIPDLPEQHRGLPQLLSVLKDFGGVRRYKAAVIEAAEVAASTSMVIKTQKLPENEEPDPVEAFDSFPAPRRSGLTLPRGWDATQLKPEQPAANHTDFLNTTLTGIGAGIGQPRNVATNDSSSYNFSSAKLDHQLYYRLIRRVQRRLMSVYDRVFNKWLYCNAGDADVAWLLVNSGEDAKKVDRDWFFAEMEDIDPQSETSAIVKKLENGLMTRAEYYARKGQDPEVQIDLWLQEQKRISIVEVLEKIETKKTPAPDPSPEPEPKQTTTSSEPVEDVQSTALNGAQVTSAVDIVIKVATGELPAESAIIILVNFFQLQESDARAIIIPAQKTYETKTVTPNPDPNNGETNNQPTE